MLRNDWIKIEGLANILEHGKPLLIDPVDWMGYRKFWRDMRVKLVNGIWVEQFGKYRYVPGRILWFGNYAYYEEWDNEQKTRVEGKPMVRDLEWHRTYYRMICDGFSGFSNADFTCYEGIMDEDFSYERQPDFIKKAIVRPDGRFKEYRPAVDALFELHDKPVGEILYHNEAKNFSEIGSRGGGKTYYEMLGGFFYDICMDGQRYYDIKAGIGKTRAVLEITSGQEAKSAEALDKLKYAMDQLEMRRELGVWGSPDDPNSNHTPVPFWKRMEGSLDANNRKNPWINSYMVDVGTKNKPKWVKRGSRSVVYHTVYPATEQGGAQKSAGGRRTYVLHEEKGLNARLLEAWNNDEGLLGGDGKKYAPQKGIGTSGNLLLVQSARRIAENPIEFKCLALTHPDDPSKKFGLFLPAYMTDMNFKDADGNTDVEAALSHWEKLHQRVFDTSEMDTYIEYAMNYPIKVKHMWLQAVNTLLPSIEAGNREEELLKGDLYKKLGNAVKLFYDPSAPNKIGYKPDPEALPFYQWPLEMERKTLDAVFMMYIRPEELMINGKIPEDAVITLYDPYVAEEWDKGGSLGCAHYVVSPKYIPQGLPGHKIAATYIGKHREGLDEHNRNVVMGHMLYGEHPGGLWYEADRGRDLRSMAIHMNGLHYLCMQPQFSDGKYNYQQNTKRTGYLVGNDLAKGWMITRLKYYLLSSSLSDGLFTSLEDFENKLEQSQESEEVVRLIIQTIDCIFTIRQIKGFNTTSNFDAVSSLLGLPLAIGEMAHHEQQKSDTDLKQHTFNALRDHLMNLKKNSYGMVNLPSGQRRY